MISGKQFNETTYNGRFVKLTNEECIHNDFEYKEGLNIDELEFDSRHACGPGGLYFCDYKDMGRWAQYNKKIMMYIWDVVIPNDAQVIYMTYKIKCDKFVLANKKPIWSNYHMCLEMVKQNGLAVQFVKEQTKEICLEAVKQNGYALRYIKKQTEELCLEAVKLYGYALKYVKEQTEEICLTAVKQNGYALQFVKEQTEEICLQAVKQYGHAVEFVKEQTEEMRLEFVKQNRYALDFLKE
jgi:hypothetical protein